PRSTFKLESDVSFIKDIVNLDWEDTRVYDYLSTTKFLLVVYEKTPDGEIFKGAKFWYMPEKELIGTVKKTWKTLKQTLINGVELTFKRVKKSAANKKGYEIENNLPSQACGLKFFTFDHQLKSRIIMKVKILIDCPLLQFGRIDLREWKI